MHWKYEADKNLVKRTAFKWTILRPGGLSNNPGEGKVDVGRTHLGKMISVKNLLYTVLICVLSKRFSHCSQRDDVAEALALLVDREDAAGLAIDIVGGDTPIYEGLDAAIKKGETDFLG